MIITDSALVKQKMPRRPADAHKGTMGTLYCVCGSYGMAGACILSAGAALRSGVGLVKIAAPRAVYPILASALPEAVFNVIEDEYFFTERSLKTILCGCNSANAALVGCGLGQEKHTQNMLKELIPQITAPLLIDADGINAAAKHIFILNRLKSRDVLITPHPKEMSRLTGLTVSEIQSERSKTAVGFAAEHSLTVLLKGKETLIAAKNGDVFKNTTGNAGLATGGSGDVLAGIAASLMAQRLTAADAAVCAAYIHGKTADILAQRTSQSYLLPQDLIKDLYLWEKE